MALGCSGSLTDEPLPQSFPTPLPAWKKWALTIANAPNTFLSSFLEFLEPISTTQDPTPGEWRHIQLVFENTVTNLKADEQVVTIDIANITNGAIDSTWTDADYTVVGGTLKNLINQWSAHMSSDISSKEIRYYRRAYNPYSDSKPFPPSGPPERVDPYVVAGQDIRVIAHQVAVTHTELVAFPRHSGRSYWPSPGGTAVFAAGGYLDTTFVDAWGTAVHDNYQTLQDNEFFPCVPTTQVNKVASRQLLGVHQVQVDNVPDVVRSRRPRTTTHRKVLPIS